MPPQTPHESQRIPSIRLISATPSAAGNSEPNSSIDLARVAPWTSQTAPPLPAAASSLRGVKPKVVPLSDGSNNKKRLVPKKSKLGLLSQRLPSFNTLNNGKENANYGSTRGHTADYSVHDNSTIDPDLGEIVMIKKKKSRAALDAITWEGAALGEVSVNAPKRTKEASKKEKKEEKKEEKWWSTIAYGRGRKDSKDKEKEKEKAPERTKTPEPALERTRFNSLDSSALLQPAKADDEPKRAIRGRISSAQLLSVSPAASMSRSSSDAPRASNQFLAPPSLLEVPRASASNTEGNTGSVAFRAMRSVRSIARMASWNQLKDSGSEEAEKEKEKDVNTKKTSKKDTMKKDKKSKDKKSKEKEKAATIRMSSSSFEAGALSPSPQPSPAPQSQTLGHKKSRILTLGLGLPSTMRIRSGSTASSVLLSPTTSFQPMASLSASVPHVAIGRDRSGSGTSSLRPASTLTNSSGGSSRLSTSSCAPSAMSRMSSSSCASVRWDEDALQTVKERRRQERKERTEQDGKSTKRDSKDSRNPRRTSLADIFPETASEPPSRPVSLTSSLEAPHVGLPLLTLETATNDGHSTYSRSSTETPVKRARPRPVSDQMLMNKEKLRPKGMMEDGEVLSILDAATNELASLINNLDLEATPATPDMTPLKPSDTSPVGRRSLEQESPLQRKGNGLRPMSSLRTVVRQASSSGAQLLGQHIAPWKDLNSQLSPAKSPPKRSTPKAKFRLTHKRTLTPSPAPEAPPVFQPLQPASRRVTPMSQQNRMSAVSTDSCHVPSMITFGSRSSSRDFDTETEDEDATNKNATIRKPRQRSSTESATGLPKLGKETKRRLGLNGTMGGSAASDYVPEDLDPSDPDSDIPDELQMILGGRTGTESDREDTLSFTGPLGGPPQLPLPVPQSQESDTEEYTDMLPAVVISEPDTLHHEDDMSSPSDEEEDTKKSFDFTGEIKRLNESGASDRASFVEQLENAFRTPAKIDLRYGFDFLKPKDVPPVPKLPFEFMKNASKTTLAEELDLAAAEPTVLTGCDSFAYSDEDVDMSQNELTVPLRNKSSAKSTGELNRDFKFGGRSPVPSTLASSAEVVEKRNSVLTLSDIIPPPDHARSLSLGEDVSNSSVFKSIFAAADNEMPTDIMHPSLHRRANSDTSVRQITRADIARRSVYDEAPSNRSSIASFSGLGDSFDEVRRGFEFHDNRPAFYPPSSNVSRSWSHCKQDSMFSFASVSSYGHVVNPGVPDPFEYGTSSMGLTSLRERPSSEEMSMSMTVDDTFSFVKHGNVLRPRQRVDSDASSFYFHAPASRSNAGHRRRESNMSVSSLAPPISLYNRSYGNARHSHRRDESSSSFSSLAHNYAMYGATGGRDVWAKHQREASADSVMSDFSGMHLGRPGIGDKMFENGSSNPMRLSAIAASPGTSIDETYDNDRRETEFDPRVSMYDSIMDGYEDQRHSMQDSLFEKTGYRSSIISSDESLFGGDIDPKFQHSRPQLRYRPISVASINSIHDAEKEEDTMITMIGGGHVRRMSVSSAVEASPCVRVGKRKYSPNTSPIEQSFESYESPKKARVIEAKPSIASTSSLKFGDERMIRATKGLLERQSLEDTCLVADGEDNSISFHSMPVFSRPRPGARSRSSTCTSSSSGIDTPPLSCSDGSSQSGGSQSSIDISTLDMMLANVTHPITATSRARTRARGRGHKRFSTAHMSRSSVYETIDEEESTQTSNVMAGKHQSPTVRQAIYIADPDSISLDGSIADETTWDNDHGIEAMRKYYALRDEAQDTVKESKRTWSDTAFSTFALQSFAIPSHPTGMQALLEHSQKNYGPLPSELRPRRIRSRTSSRASPYTVPTPVRAIKRAPSPAQLPQPVEVAAPLPLQEVRKNANIPQTSLDHGKLLDQDDKVLKPDLNSWGLPRPRVPSGTRRVALGWSKRSAGAKTSSKSSTGLKENAPPKVSTGLKENSGMGMTPGQTLRINRPRPKGRPTPATIRSRPVAIYN